MSTGDRTTSVEYREIPGRPGFRFGSDGSVRTAWTLGVKPRIGSEWRLLKAEPRPTGYSWVYLGSRKTTRMLRLDELICEAYCGPRPPGTECLHRDGDRRNCDASNLRWGVAPENARDPSVEYRAIPECEGYEFGSDGSVWSYWGTGYDRPGDVPRRMNPTTLDSGHLQVTVRCNGEMRRFGAHHLVAWAFHGPCPDGLECCHDNGIPSDNRPDNLRWDTASANMGDRRRHGVMVCGESQWNARLTEAIVIEARRRYAAGESTTRLAEAYGVSAFSIGRAICGKTWSHVPGAVPLRDRYATALSDEQIADIRRRYEAGATSDELAAMFGVSNMTILRAVRGDIGAHLPGTVAIRNDRRKLSDEQEEELCRLADGGGWTLKRLAERYGVHKQTVANILSRRQN